MANKNLNAAKKAKNDEFWTLMPDIEKEVSQYKDQFEDKVIYCNCDDYRWSNFYKHFKDHFKEYKLKRLIASCLTGEYASYDGNVETTGKLQNGDFRSEECIELLKEADIVVTNPPFSLFREFIATLVQYGKKFLVIGNQNAITYKEIFPLIKENKLWTGNNMVKTFRVPQVTNKNCEVLPNGDIIAKFGSICWFTNLDIKKRYEEIILYKKYNEEEFPKYDNYDAIEVSKVCEIPKDYDGVMGVPITFLDKYNPSQFEIVKFRKGDDDKDLCVNGKRPYFRILIRKK